MNNLKNTWHTGLLFLLFVAIYLVVSQIDPKSIHLKPDMLELIKHIPLILAAMMGIHLLEKVWFWKETKNYIEDSVSKVLQSTLPIVNNANSMGLEMVFTNRDKAIPEIKKCLASAKNRVWLLGIAFSESVSLDSILGTMPKDISDFKVLMIDPLRSPAVYRSFLESNPEELENILNYNRNSSSFNGNLDPYFHQRMYRDFQKTFSIFLSNYDKYVDSVRFYGLNSSCWAIFVDDVVFFQPYTYGRGEEYRKENLCIGGLMPVFKYRKTDLVNTFNIIEDHFAKLWMTTNLDLFHMKARVADRVKITKSIFEKRKYWLKYIFMSLCKIYTCSIEEKRGYTRVCEHNPKAKLRIVSQDSRRTNGKRFDCTVLNYSQKGLCIETNSRGYLEKGDLVVLDRIDQKETKVVYHAVQEMGNGNKPCFNVVWKNESNRPFKLGLELCC